MAIFRTPYPQNCPPETGVWFGKKGVEQFCTGHSLGGLPRSCYFGDSMRQPVSTLSQAPCDAVPRDPQPAVPHPSPLVRPISPSLKATTPQVKIMSTVMSHLPVALGTMLAIALGSPLAAQAAPLEALQQASNRQSLPGESSLFPTSDWAALTQIVPGTTMAGPRSPHLHSVFATSSNQDPPHRGDDRRQ